jgi:hypothetical protein
LDLLEHLNLVESVHGLDKINSFTI